MNASRSEMIVANAVAIKILYLYIIITIIRRRRTRTSGKSVCAHADLES